MTFTLTSHITSPGCEWHLKSLANWQKRLWAAGRQLLSSLDGGSSWRSCKPLAQSSLAPQRIVFLDAWKALLLALRGSQEAVLYCNEDDGRDWNQLYRFPSGHYVWTEIAAYGSHLWFVNKGDRGTVLHILNCVSLRHENLRLTFRGIPRGIVFRDERVGWILEQWKAETWVEGVPRENRTLIHRSEDSGRSWSVVAEIPETCGTIIENDSALFSLSEVGTLFRSDDDGRRWSAILRTNTRLLDLAFADGVGVLIGTQDLIRGPKDIELFMTKDGGRTWSKINHQIKADLFAVRMTDSASGVLASSDSLWTFSLDQHVGQHDKHLQ